MGTDNNLKKHQVVDHRGENGLTFANLPVSIYPVLPEEEDLNDPATLRPDWFEGRVKSVLSLDGGNTFHRHVHRSLKNEDAITWLLSDNSKEDPFLVNTQNLVESMDSLGLLGLRFDEMEGAWVRVRDEGSHLTILDQLSLCHLDNGIENFLISHSLDFKTIGGFYTNMETKFGNSGGRAIIENSRDYFWEYKGEVLKAVFLQMLMFSAKSSKSGLSMCDLLKSGQELSWLPKPPYLFIGAETRMSTRPSDMVSKRMGVFWRRVQSVNEFYSKYARRKSLSIDLLNFKFPMSRGLAINIVHALDINKVRFLGPRTCRYLTDAALFFGPNLVKVDERVLLPLNKILYDLSAHGIDFKRLFKDDYQVSPELSLFCEVFPKFMFLARNLSMYLEIKDVKRPLEGRPDVFMASGNEPFVESRDKVLRPNHEIYKRVVLRTREFVKWLLEFDPGLASRYHNMGQKIVNGVEDEELPTKQVERLKEELNVAYKRFLQETSQSRMELKIRVYEFKSGNNSKHDSRKMAQANSRRAAIMVLILSGLTRKRNQGWQEWLNDIENPLYFTAFVDDAEFRLSTIKTGVSCSRFARKEVSHSVPGIYTVSLASMAGSVQAELRKIQKSARKKKV